MIFLSHTHADKQIVDEIARALSGVFGQGAIFYDSWSIQPGDGIIDRMNNGMSECKFFFFFVSKQSLQSNMVKLEWQNALLKSTKGETRIVPVRLDDVLMPDVLLQTLYIDIFNEGLATGIRQMVDVISGQNTYRRPSHTGFQNIRAYWARLKEQAIVEFRAEVYMEPHSRYLILLENKQEEVTWTAKDESMFESGFHEGVELSNGCRVNALLVARTAATSPGFPFTIEMTALGTTPLRLVGAMRVVARGQFASVPLIELSHL